MPAAYQAPTLVLGSSGKQPLSCEEAGNYPQSVGFCFVLHVEGEGLSGFLPGSLVYELICCRLDKYQTWTKENRTVHLGEEDEEQGFPFQCLAVKLTLMMNAALI